MSNNDEQTFHSKRNALALKPWGFKAPRSTSKCCQELRGALGAPILTGFHASSEPATPPPCYGASWSSFSADRRNQESWSQTKRGRTGQQRRAEGTMPPVVTGGAVCAGRPQPEPSPSGRRTAPCAPQPRCSPAEGAGVPAHRVATGGRYLSAQAEGVLGP